MTNESKSRLIALKESQIRDIKKFEIEQSKIKNLLNEENSGIKKKIKNIIRQYTNPYCTDFLDTPITELPYNLKEMVCPGGHETAMYKAVANNPNENKFIDFLKLNVYDQFGTKYDRGPWEYIVGAARIACSELGFYSFDPYQLRGGDIIKFAKMVRLIHYNKDFFLDGEQDMDRDLNGMSYEQFMDKFLERYNAFKEDMANQLDSEEIVDKKYEVVRIQDVVTPQGARPVGPGANILNQLGNYTDWCICGGLQNFEYPQYTAGGGAVYIMIREDYKDVKKEPGENCPLDDYGLSLICVIVGPDGIPDNITTRWNHEHGGENPEGMHTALQLQRITGVRYTETFKPRNVEDLHRMNIRESANKPSAMDQVHNKVNSGIMDAVTGGGMMEEDTIEENSNDRKVNKYIKEKFGLTDFQDIRNKVMEIYEKIPYARINGGRYMLGVLRLLFEENIPREDYGILNKILYKIGNSNYYERASVNDENLGGWSFEQLKEKYFVPDFEGDNFSTSEKIVKLPNGYTITRIDTYDEMNARCDGEWCISYDENMWLELVSDETVYLVENEKLIDKFDEYYESHSDECQEIGYAAGEEDEMMEMGLINDDLSWVNQLGSWKFPYDMYGLSRFVVLVGKKWITVYSRYNMPNEFDGDYLTKEQLEKLLGVKFEDVFKYVPRDDSNGHYDNYGRWRVDAAPSVTEGAEPEANEYKIGGEGGNNEYFHAVNENVRTIVLTEGQLNSIGNLILENEGTNMAKARKYLERNGYSDPNERQEILNTIRTEIPNSRAQQCKFLLGVTRFYISGELDLSDGNTKSNLNKTLKCIADGHADEYNYDLNGESLNTLIERFKSVVSGDLEQAIARSNSRQLSLNKNYKIVPIDNPDEASAYGEYTSWCVTHNPDMYEAYTNDGLGRFFFCLRKGFENEPEVVGEGCPLDSYGLSMIAVSINADGSVNTITCRWNHDNGGNDNIMTVDELEDLLGRNFYQTFKPYSREELHAKGFVFFDEVQGLLDSGVAPEKIFKSIVDASNGFSCVELNRKYNFINKDNRLISDIWFDIANNFDDGFAAVYLMGKGQNYINQEGKFISDQWFEKLCRFYDGCARVYVKSKGWNFINKEGKLISSDKYFNDARSFYNGFAAVYINGKGWNFINKEGKLISDRWFDDVSNFSEGFAAVYINGKGWTFINQEGKLISSQCFDKIRDFSDGYAPVYINDKGWNFINEEGNLISGQWFESVGDYCFRDGFAAVYVMGKGWNYIDKEGNPISDQWFEKVFLFCNGFAAVYINGKGWNFINKEGKLISDRWFDDVSNFSEGFAKVYIRGTGFYKLNRNGQTMDYNGHIIDLNSALNESKIGNFDFKKYFKPIAEFMRKDGLNVYPYPKVKLNWEPQDGLFIKTGYYEPESKTIVIFCDDRHPKDILRTFCHEMIHHSQNLDGADLNFSSNDDVKDNERLEEIESEAYLKGNVYFRKWTEYQSKEKDLLQEGKERKNDKGEKVPEKCDKCGGDVVCQIHGEPVFVCKDCGKYFGTVPFTFPMNEDVVNEDTDPDDIDLSSFNIKTKLNPKFWKNDRIDSRIRMKLLDIADDFIEFLGVDWVKPDDIIMTGSLANYNWNKRFSDIDLHILIDFSKVDKRRDFVKNYFDSKKNQWNDSHEGLKIYGFNVELYVQDTNEKHSSTGVYSLEKDKWLKEPDRDLLKSSKINLESIKKSVAKYVDKIDKLCTIYKGVGSDEYKARKLSDDVETLWDEIKSQRKNGLEDAKSEITNGNIIYKSLRRMGYLDKIFGLRDGVYDKMNSLNEHNN